MVEPGEEVEYYFEVWDNDGVSGPKSSRTQSMVFRAPTLQELAEKAELNADKMKASLEKSIQQSKITERSSRLYHAICSKKTMG
ncbi:MAG: hypothetical protein IPL74_12295 [Bacteroidetes bacterium]|nr:hypothetical protein [Bacteroidota bacterium]